VVAEDALLEPENHSVQTSISIPFQVSDVMIVEYQRGTAGVTFYRHGVLKDQRKRCCVFIVAHKKGIVGATSFTSRKIMKNCQKRLSVIVAVDHKDIVVVTCYRRNQVHQLSLRTLTYLKTLSPPVAAIQYWYQPATGDRQSARLVRQ